MDETAPKRRANSGSFSKGNPRPGPGRGKKKPKEAGGSEALADMQRAYTTAEQDDDPPGVKAARDLLHEDYKTFMQLYTKLQGGPVFEAVQEVEAAATVGPKELDLEELAERLLKEWEEEESRERS